MIANKLIIYGFSAFAGIVSTVGSISIFKDKIELADENKSLKENLAIYREEYLKKSAQLDSVIKVKCYTPQDTVLCFVHGYNQAIADHAGSFRISEGQFNMVYHDGTYKWWIDREVTIQTEKKLLEGSGNVLPVEIRIRK